MEPNNFVNVLSKSIGLKTSTMVLDLALECISQSYQLYYSFSPDQITGLDMVLEVLANATLYSCKFGEIPERGKKSYVSPLTPWPKYWQIVIN